MSKEKQFRKWHIELVLDDGRVYREIWNLNLPDGEFVGFTDGWFHIGNKMSIIRHMVLDYKIEDCGLTA